DSPAGGHKAGGKRVEAWIEIRESVELTPSGVDGRRRANCVRMLHGPELPRRRAQINAPGV
ncbi:MAG TPA: hypothetical protein VGO18_16680, partial [Steroidobacteraceae bacterium]|nr:hypothetical protein [Steroidobacteraceae bacterium]